MSESSLLKGDGISQYEIAKKILEEEHGIRFVEPGKKIETTTLDYSALEDYGLEADLAEDFIKQIVRFLAFPVIEDNFSDNRDDERREWKKKLFRDEQYGNIFREIVESNRLRMNNLGGFTAFFDMFFDLAVERAKRDKNLPPIPVELSQLNIGLKPLRGGEYQRMNINEKKSVVSNLSVALENFIRLFSSETKSAEISSVV